jgi:Flp pilus assembly protein TadD
LRLLQGNTVQAGAILRAWLELQPLQNPSRMLHGEVLRNQGDSAGAIGVLQVALQQAPRNIVVAWILSMAYLDTGESERARALLESMRPDFETNLVWSHGWAILLAAEGKPDEARHTLDDATLKFARVAWLDTSATADLYALTGDNSKAMPPSF